MAIEFVIEDGTAKADATSYASVAQYRQYWENRGVDYSAVALDTVQVNLNKATEYIDSNYDFDGYVVDDDQALQWPRCESYDRNGYVIDSDTIPTKLIDAVCYMAAQTGLNDALDGVTSISYGPVSKTFNGQGKTFPVCDKLLKDVVIQGVKVVRVN